MIIEDGERDDFKQCLFESLRLFRYPCGCVHVFENWDEKTDEFMPMYCQYCQPGSVLFVNGVKSSVVCTINYVVHDGPQTITIELPHDRQM